MARSHPKPANLYCCQSTTRRLFSYLVLVCVKSTEKAESCASLGAIVYCAEVGPAVKYPFCNVVVNFVL